MVIQLSRKVSMSDYISIPSEHFCITSVFFIISDTERLIKQHISLSQIIEFFFNYLSMVCSADARQFMMCTIRHIRRAPLTMLASNVWIAFLNPPPLNRFCEILCICVSIKLKNGGKFLPSKLIFPSLTLFFFLFFFEACG